MRRVLVLAASCGVAALGRRVVRSRRRRSLHPDGRSFAGDLEVFGRAVPVGAPLVDHPGRYRVVVRLSKGIGTRRDWPDVRGVALRIFSADNDFDLLLSTMGRHRSTRHLPALRRSFDVGYGSITSYRTGSGRKVYLSAGPDPDRTPLGATLDEVVVAAGHEAALLLYVDDYRSRTLFGRVAVGDALSPAEDDALAFDPVRHSSPGLHPSGTVHGSRAFAYRLSQRWRHVRPAPADPAAVRRTAQHR